MRKKIRRVFAALLLLCSLGLLRANPLQILEVDASNYPEIRMRLALQPLHPSFIEDENRARRQSFFTEPKLRFSEIYQNNEFSIEETSFRPISSQASLQVVFLIDATRSVSKANFRKSKKLAQSFLKSLSPSDRSAIYALKTRPLLVADVSSQQKQQIEKLNKIKRDGRHTRLYDSLYSALYTAHSLAHGVKKMGAKTAVVVFTDAKEEDSFLSDNDCLELSKIGKELSIPVYIILADSSKKEHADKKRGQTKERLRRIALKTGGQIWLLKKINKTPESIKAIFAEIRRPAVFEAEYRWTRPKAKPTPWPGDKILVRVGLKQDETDYTALSSYRVPFGAYVRSEYGASSILLAAVVTSIILFLIFLFLVIILLSLWMRRLPEEGRSKNSRPLLARFRKKGSSGNGQPPLEEGDALQNLAGYVGETREGLSESGGSARGVALHPAPTLMEDERRLYMREYNYRLLQLALREAGRYERAALVTLAAPEKKEGRRYDLFLETTVIGSGRWANIPLHDNTASPIHAKIKRVDQSYVLYDMLSAGGVYRNGKKILRPRGLRNGDEIRIGRSKFRFEGGAALES